MPVFVKGAAAPLITPVMLLAVPVLFTVTPVVVAMAPAVRLVVVTDRLVSGVVPPTAPAKLVEPVVLVTRVTAPSTVEPKLRLPLLVLVSVVFAPRVTGSLYVCAPVVFTLPPLIAVVPGASVVTLVSAVVPPTAPLKVVAPAVLAVRFTAPLMVEPKVRLPLLVLVSVVFAPSVTALLYVCAPMVVTLPPLIAVVPVAATVRLPSGPTPPTAPLNVVAPEAFTVRLRAEGKAYLRALAMSWPPWPVQPSAP